MPDHPLDGKGTQSKSALIGLLIFGVVAIGLVVYAVKAGTPLRYYDEREYLDIAQSISRGDGFSVAGVATATRPPSWPLLLGAALFIGVPASALTALSAMLMVGAGCAAAYVGVRTAGSRWGALAGLLMLLYPLNVYSASTLYPQAAATAILMALWAIAARTVDAEKRRLSAPMCAAVGVLIAALALAVPTLIFTGAAIGLWFLWQQRGNRLRYAVVAGLCACLPVVAWGVRNSVEIGSPVLFSTTSGWNMYLGNNPEATGTSGVRAYSDDTVRSAAGLTEVEQDTYYRDAALHWITAHPADAAQLYVAKFANYFAPYNAPATESQGGRLEMVAAIGSFLAILVGTVARFLLRARAAVRPSELLFGVIFFANAFVMSVFFTRTRFRQPLDSFLIVEAAIAIAIVAVAWQRRAREK